MNRERLGFGLILVVIAVVTIYATLNLRPAPAVEAEFVTVTPSQTATDIPTATPTTGIEINNFQPDSQLNNCTFPSSEWLRYRSTWDFDSIRVGNSIHTKKEVEDILRFESSDVTIGLLRQLLTVVLNQRNGASPETILQDLEIAISWVEDHPVGSTISPQDRKSGTELSAKLTDFNNGIIGPGTCKFTLASPTPTNTYTPEATPTATNTATATITSTRRPVQFVPTATRKPVLSNDRPTSTPVPPSPEPTEEPPPPVPTSAPTSVIP